MHALDILLRLREDDLLGMFSGETYQGRWAYGFLREAVCVS